MFTVPLLCYNSKCLSRYHCTFPCIFRYYLVLALGHQCQVSKASLATPFKTLSLGTSLVVQWLRHRLPMQGVQVQSLVGELRSHMPRAKEPKHKTEAIL